ncbi:hypothetical protein Tco_1257239 [Tanacetum coccineum]
MGVLQKASAARKYGSAASEHISSPEPIRTVDPTGLAVGNRFGADVETDELREDRSLHVHVPPHDSANRSIHNYTDARDDEETNSLRLGSLVDQSGRNLTLVQTELFQSSSGNHSVHPSPTVERTTSPTRSRPQGTHVEEGESSRCRAYYVPEWLIHRRCRVDTPAWCRELMVHLAPLATQEESNALNNATALERAWFNLGRGALAQTDILERFENLQADYDKLAETKCEETIRKVVQARLDLQHNATLYNDMNVTYRKLNGEHEGCTEKLQEKEKLVAQLSQTEMEKFDCIRKLLPTVVSRLFQSYEYKQSLSEPFNLAIQVGWAKGLTEERSKEDLLDLMSRMEGFDAYADKKMYVEYDKLFEKRYPFMERISNGFRHSVVDLLKVYPEPPPSERAPSVTVGPLGDHALAHPFDFCLWGIVIPLGVMPWLLPLADEVYNAFGALTDHPFGLLLWCIVNYPKYLGCFMPWNPPLRTNRGIYNAFGCYALAHQFDFCLWGIVMPLGAMPWLIPLTFVCGVL